MMNLETLQWDAEILSDFGIPATMLPHIASSGEVYGHIAAGPLAGVPLAGDLGDQQAALVGQACFHSGQAKNTYGTGCFLLLNTGVKPVQSKCGLLTTVAYKLGSEPTHYALEGSVAITGALVQWLRDNLKVIDSSAEIEALASSVEDNGGVYFVPAFSGLFAPYWKTNARGAILGLTRYANRAHLARAVLEATAFQTREVVEAMEQDSGIRLDVLRSDGGMTVNEVLMRFWKPPRWAQCMRLGWLSATIVILPICAATGRSGRPGLPDCQPRSVNTCITCGRRRWRGRLIGWKKLNPVLSGNCTGWSTPSGVLARALVQ